jgi:acetyl-CoA synthetase (ADP-forming)
MKSTTALLERARKQGRHFLLEPEAKLVCSEYGIPVVRFKEAKNLDDALHLAAGIGYPVVLKVISPQILHKSEVGGVVPNIRGPKDLRGAYARMLASVKKHAPDASIAGVLVEEMVPPSTEVIIGSTKDPQFGPVMMFGLGGIFVEVLKDVSFRVPPITKGDALEMVREIKGYRVLEGFRNQPPADIDSLVDILMHVSNLLTDHPDLREIDLNPIIVYRKGAKAVDARMILD